MNAEGAEALSAATALLGPASRLVVLTGAGISTDSGIPDFRGPDGIWTRDPEAERLSTIAVYLSQPEIRVRAWKARLANPAWTAEPNAGHRAIVSLQHDGRLDTLVTQNVDGLHLRSGIDPSRLVEVHGSIREARCVGCGWTGPMVDVLDRVRAGEADPPCGECGGILKSDTVFFGEALRSGDIDRAWGAACNADVVLAVGTTLQVYPVAEMVPIAVRNGAKVVIVNGQPTAMDELADVTVRGPISEVLPAIVGGDGRG